MAAQDLRCVSIDSTLAKLRAPRSQRRDSMTESYRVDETVVRDGTKCIDKDENR